MKRFFLILTILCPIGVLILDPSISRVVCGIVISPLLLLITGFSYYLTYSLKIYFNEKVYLRTINTIAFLIILIGIYHQFTSYQHNRRSHQMRQDLALISKCYQDIENYAKSKRWANIRLSIDYVTDYLNQGVMSTLSYESKGQFPNLIVERMSNNLFSPITLSEALDSLQQSNVVILTIGKFPKKTLFPTTQSIAQFRPMLIQYADQHFDRLGDYQFMGYRRRIYVSRQ